MESPPINFFAVDGAGGGLDILVAGFVAPVGGGGAIKEDMDSDGASGIDVRLPPPPWLSTIPWASPPPEKLARLIVGASEPAELSRRPC